MSAWTKTYTVKDYDLGVTLESGQAFRWRLEQGGWSGVIGPHWVRLRSVDSMIIAETAEPMSEWSWLEQYLQTEVDLDGILSTFPGDEPMRAAVNSCRGLRLLRQDPWECLASFILSSTKQIVQIQQVVASVCERFGDPVKVPAGFQPTYSFPAAPRMAGASESELRCCKMGFRAPYLLAAAEAVARGALDLQSLREVSIESARQQLMELPGVGRKIADCVLLFAYGFATAFPIDVWVSKALRSLYFPGKTIGAAALQLFCAGHFGPHAGYAQQYLFHYIRTNPARPAEDCLQEKNDYAETGSSVQPG